MKISERIKNTKNSKYCGLDKKLILVTVHRRENIGKRLEQIAKGILLILSKNENVYFLIPMHPNPKVRHTLNKLLSKNSRINLCEPFKYTEMISVLKQSYFIMTDSGGIQEEAPSLNKPVLVLRDTTERPEGLSQVLQS